MGIDYSVHVFYGSEIGRNLNEEEIDSYDNKDVVYPEGFGYMTIGNWMGNGDIVYYLTYGKAIGGNPRYMDDEGSITEGIRLDDQDIDQEWARHAFAEVCEKNGWPYNEPGWYVGMSIS